MKQLKTGKGRFHHHSHDEHGESWMVASALLRDSLTFEELLEYFRIMGRRFGMFLDVLERGEGEGEEKRNFHDSLKKTIQRLLEKEWIVLDGERYRLTETGREQANLMIEDMKRGGVVLEKATKPETVSKMTMIVHFILGAIKMPAALLSGSVGLFNDALDTLMDGISSLFVFIGVRRGKERLASYVLLIFMTSTGLFSLSQAILRFFRPEPLAPDAFSFTAVVSSALLCSGLWFYQKYSGLKHSCIPLIAQSIDSRNHILVAGGVAAALAASYLDFPLLDHIVGVIVSVLILKGALELFLDLIRSGSDEEIDLSKYGFGRFEQHRHKQVVRWVLFEIRKGRVSSQQEMEREARAATDFSKIAPLQALGLAEQSNREEMIRNAVQAVFHENLAEGNPLRLTAKGEQVLEKALSGQWKLTLHTDNSPGTPHMPAFRIIGILIQLFFSALLFCGIVAISKTVLDLLPQFYSWTDFPTFFSIRGFDFTLPQFSLFVVGFILFFLGRRLMHRSRRLLSRSIGHEERHSPHFLVTTGVFENRRHPLYAGLNCITIGVAVGVGSLYFLILAALGVVIRFFSVLREEKYLIERFTEAYLAYRIEVPVRFHPWYVRLVIGFIFGVSLAGVFG